MKRQDYIKATQAAIINQPKYWAKHHNDRVLADGGTVTDKTPEEQRSYLTDYYKFLRETRLIDNLVFSWDGSAGIKTRTSGVNEYAAKAYDMSASNNDAVQATEANQPFVGGGIAPNEKRRMKANSYVAPAKSISHQSIEIGNNNPFTVTYVFKHNNTDGSILNSQFVLGGGGIRLGNSTIIINTGTRPPKGSTVIIQFVGDSSGGRFYMNGVSYPVTTYNPANIISLTNILSDISGYQFDGEIYHYSVFNKALSASEVQAQHAYLRLQHPEIEGINIGNQHWATSNYEGVVTGNGTIIPEVQDASTATNPELVIGGDFESGLIGSSNDNGGGGVISTWSLNTSNPISGTQDGRLVITTAGVGENSLYRPLLQVPMSMKQNQRYIIKFDYKVNSGTVIWSGISLGTGANDLSFIVLSGTGTTQREFTITGTPALSLALYFNGTNLFDLQIDNISIKEVGWADLTTPAWCYYNNDPLNGAIYGKLYNGYAALVIKDNPPAGWRIPTDADFNQLKTYLGGTDYRVYSSKLSKEGLKYWGSAYGTNETGFSAVSSGLRIQDGTFAGLGVNLGTITNGSDVLQISNNTASTYGFNVNRGFAIRLIRND